MDYVSVSFGVDCPAELRQPACDLLAAMAAEAGLEAFSMEGGSLVGYAAEDRLDEAALETAVAEFPMEGVSVSYSVSRVEGRNWNEAWEDAGFDPIEVAGRLVVYDAKHADGHDCAGRVCIGIDTRQAFGTGTHQTTRLMLAAMVGMGMEGKRVLDCGTGTGILGIAALKLGAAEAVAYDIDEWSVENAQHNAGLNGVDMAVLHGNSSVLSHISGLFDAVLANINRNVLMGDLAAMAGVLHHGGRILLSGFLSADTHMLIEKAAEAGLESEGVSTDGDWACIALRQAQ